ncbi:MAG TPA: hypothetical protein VNL92_05055 [Dehalococcoidia bacterium]|nr:hypothetical protein [Dehalococcoidia bacterium]
MDNDYGIDIAGIIRTIQSADVMTFRFVILSERLLFDTRSNELDGPMLAIVPRVDSAEERFRSVRRLRPRFANPERISTLWWPRRVESLVSTGVWDAIMRRIIESPFPRCSEVAQRTLGDLVQLQQSEIRHAITGEGYRSLWECRS